MALVEFADQCEQPVGRGVEMRGEFGDFVFQAYGVRPYISYSAEGAE